MGVPTHASIVGGTIDTSSPSTHQPPGILLKAFNNGTRWLGPRRGGQQQTWFGQIVSNGGSGFVGCAPNFSFDGTDTYVSGTMPYEQAGLGLRWTVDLAFHPFAARAVNATVPIFIWRVGVALTAFEIGIYGSSHANANKVYAIVNTIVGGVVSNTYTLVGGAVSYGNASTHESSGKIVRVFVRLVRDGGTLTLIDSTGATATNATLSTAETSESGDGTWVYGRDSGLSSNDTFNGLVLRALVRDAVGSTDLHALPAMEHIYPRSRSVRFAGSTAAWSGSSGLVPDESRFGSHGLVATPGSVSVGDRHYPFAKTIQGLGSFSDNRGKRLSAVMIGGLLTYARLA